MYRIRYILIALLLQRTFESAKIRGWSENRKIKFVSIVDRGLPLPTFLFSKKFSIEFSIHCFTTSASTCVLANKTSNGSHSGTEKWYRDIGVNQGGPYPPARRRSPPPCPAHTPRSVKSKSLYDVSFFVLFHTIPALLLKKKWIKTYQQH